MLGCSCLGTGWVFEDPNSAAGTEHGVELGSGGLAALESFNVAPPRVSAVAVPASLDIAEAIGQARQAIVTQVKLSPDSEIAETPW